MADTEYQEPRPDTVVMIHGLWMTALCWEHWVARYSSFGYRVVARSWPGMDRDVQELRHDPSCIAGLGLGEIVEHYERIVVGLDSSPIIMGHGFGGLITQILLDRGLGVAGVAIAAAPLKGIDLLPFPALSASFPALRGQLNDHRAAALTPEQFHHAFGTNLSEEGSRKVYERYAVPGLDCVGFQSAFTHFSSYSTTTLNAHHGERAPLLLITGGKDDLAPASVTEAGFELYRTSSEVTDYRVFPDRSHYILGEPGWEEVADYALAWALENGSAHHGATDAL